MLYKSAADVSAIKRHDIRVISQVTADCFRGRLVSLESHKKRVVMSNFVNHHPPPPENVVYDMRKRYHCQYIFLIDMFGAHVSGITGRQINTTHIIL